MERAAKRFDGKALEDLYALEIFCGAGRLCGAIRKLGMHDSVGIDSTVHKHLKSPILRLDLTKNSSIELVERMISQETLAFIHFAPPCGTASRARNIYRPEYSHNPPPCRSDHLPDGLKFLRGTLKLRVELANRLYWVTGYLFKQAWDHGILASVENPSRSFFWQTSHWRQHTSNIPFLSTEFHHCCYGSQRRKRTKLAHTIPSLISMAAFCPGESDNHKHLPWGQTQGRWATAEETAYPVELCNVWASRVCEMLLELGAVGRPQQLAEYTANPHRASQILNSTQPKAQRVPPLVKEFKSVVTILGPMSLSIPNKVVDFWQIPSSCEVDPPGFLHLPPGSRVIRSHNFSARGDGVVTSEKDLQVKSIVGIPWTPDEFLQAAKSAEHPRNLLSGIPLSLRQTIDHCMSVSDEDIGRTRCAEMRRWLSTAKDLRAEEDELKSNLPEHCAQVLKDKRLCLFRELLKQSGFTDTGFADQMCVGFKLSGPINPSSSFRKKRTSASMTVSDLKQSAKRVRTGILMSCRSSGDDKLDCALQEATDLELEKGWIWGPVNEDSLSTTSVVSRRFGIWQGGKCRPIDNLLESGINATTSAEDTICIHTADCIVAGIVHRLRSGLAAGKHEKCLTKSWDLKKAYKQLPVHSDSLDESYLAVFNPLQNKPLIYGQRVLPFGSRASVHGFCRVATAMWHLGVTSFLLHWCAYFDDYVIVENDNLCRLGGMCVDLIFRLLGWTTSVDKETPFSDLCVVLGLEINLREIKLGMVLVQNTQKRKNELSQSIASILESGKLSPKEGQSLRGRLIFAENQIFGRQAVSAVRALSAHISKGKQSLGADTISALRFLADHVIQGSCRRISTHIGETFHLYIDASLENSGALESGIGCVLVDPSGNICGRIAFTLDKLLIDSLNLTGSKHPIYELECFAMFVGLYTWRKIFSGRHLIIFTDNNGSLGAMIAGDTRNLTARRIVENVNWIIDSFFIIPWFERVNTASNIADLPSRTTCEDDLNALGRRIHVDAKSLINMSLSEERWGKETK